MKSFNEKVSARINAWLKRGAERETKAIFDPKVEASVAAEMDAMTKREPSLVEAKPGSLGNVAQHFTSAKDMRKWERAWASAKDRDEMAKIERNLALGRWRDARQLAMIAGHLRSAILNSEDGANAVIPLGRAQTLLEIIWQAWDTEHGSNSGRENSGL